MLTSGGPGKYTQLPRLPYNNVMGPMCPYHNNKYHSLLSAQKGWSIRWKLQKKQTRGLIYMTDLSEEEPRDGSVAGHAAAEFYI